MPPSLAFLRTARRDTVRTSFGTRESGAAVVSELAAALLAVASGLFYWAALPPHHAWPLAFVSWAPLLIASHGRKAGAAAVLGGLSGFVISLLGCSWYPDVIKTFGNLPAPVCVAIASALYTYQAGRTALVMWMTSRAAENGWRRAGAFLAAFAALELFYPLIFPWYSASQLFEAPLLAQAADLGGAVFVGVLLTAGSLAPYELAVAWLEKRKVRKSVVAFAALGPALLAAYGVVRLPQVKDAVSRAPRAEIGIVQGNTPHDGISRNRALALYRSATETLAHDPPLDLAIWPETAIPDAIADDALQSTLTERVVGGVPFPAPVLSGAILKRGDAYFQSGLLFSERGEKLGVYDKVHPLIVGEYLPFASRFPKLREWIPNIGGMSAGTDTAPLRLGAHKIAVLICYEELLAGYVNEVVRDGVPDLLVNITNDAWFGSSDAAPMHLAFATLRAIEHRRYLVRATNSGVSAFVSPTGEVSGETGMMVAAAERETVRWMHEGTLYEALGDRPFWAVSILGLGMALFKRRRAR